MLSWITLYALSRTTANLILFAPQAVIQALYDFTYGTRVGANPTDEQHDTLLTNLIRAIRSDIMVSPSGDYDFVAKLWTSGANSK